MHYPVKILMLSYCVMNNISTNSDESQTDASLLGELDRSILQQLFDYSLGSLNRVQSRFAALDSKASQSMGLIAVVGGILVFGAPSVRLKSGFGEVILSVAVVCLLCSALCSLLCLRIRTTMEPPTVEKAIDWLRAQNQEKLESRMLSALIIDLAHAEYSHIHACLTKSRFLLGGQIFQMVGVTLLFAWFVLSKLT